MFDPFEILQARRSCCLLQFGRGQHSSVKRQSATCPSGCQRWELVLCQSCHLNNRACVCSCAGGARGERQGHPERLQAALTHLPPGATRALPCLNGAASCYPCPTTCGRWQGRWLTEKHLCRTKTRTQRPASTLRSTCRRRTRRSQVRGFACCFPLLRTHLRWQRMLLAHVELFQNPALRLRPCGAARQTTWRARTMRSMATRTAPSPSSWTSRCRTGCSLRSATRSPC